MKWIGQHIVDFIARFRSDVYLEDISTGTIVSGGSLGLDSNNKVVKATGASVDVSDFMTNGVNNRVLTSTGTDAMNAEVGLTFDGSTLVVDGDLDVSAGDISVNSITAGQWEGTTIPVNRGGTGLATVGTSEILTGNGTGALSSEPHLFFGQDRLTIGDATANIQPYLRLSNDENIAEIGLANGTNDFITGSVDGDLVITSTGDYHVIIAQNDTAALTIDTDGSVVIASDLHVTTGLILDSVDVTTIQTGAESHADNDTSLMTSAAIKDLVDAGGGSADGWHGSNTRIKILPTDFVPSDGGRPVMIEDDNLGINRLFLYSFGSFPMYAYIPIPTGFKATHVKIFGSDTGQNFTTYEGDIDSKTVALKGSATSIGTEKAITNVTSDTTNYLVIAVTSDGSTDEIHGGYVKIIAV